tara:strand:- start:10233 stop:11111 length:879 start_codon:yes stop_codon:yes gene_type:complete
MPTPINTSADYYGDSNLFGNYQYVTLEDIVNNYIMSSQDDDFTANANRRVVLFQARRAFRELYFDSMQEIKGIKLDLSPTLTVTLPPDFVNFVRISWVDGLGKLHELSVNNKLDIAREYLQDTDYGILFDGEGCALEANNIGLDIPDELADIIADGVESFQFSTDNSFVPNKNFSEDFSSGGYVLDRQRGLIIFGSETFGKSVVLEYLSDGLYTGCEGRAEAELKIHKFAEDAVYNWIYWKLIERRRNVPANAKQLARKEWFNSRRLCKRRMQTIRPSELRKVFKGANRWIK